MDLDIDYELEEFYINFKQSMINFYKKHTFTRPLNNWSQRLNLYKDKKQYQYIQKLIIKIISLYAIDLMRTKDEYNAGILITNIKRFNKITITNTKIEKIDFNSNIVFLLLNIFSSLSKKEDTNFISLFDQVELYIIHQDFTDLIKYSVENNYNAILDKLFNYSSSILDTAKELYNINFKGDKLSAKKFVSLIVN
mgnify:CR=1 FL=1|jgi:hypothetical protein